MAEDVNDLIDKLEQLISLGQGGGLSATRDRLNQIRSLVKEIGEQDVSEAQARTLNKARAAIDLQSQAYVKLGKTAQGAFGSTQNLTQGIKDAAAVAGSATIITSFASLIGKVDEEVFKKLPFLPELYKAAGMEGAKSLGTAFTETYDKAVVPIFKQAQANIGDTFGQLTNEAGQFTEKTLAGRVALGAQRAAEMSDALGKSLGNTTNSFRFLRSGVAGVEDAMKLAGQATSDLRDQIFLLGEKGIDQAAPGILMRFSNALRISREDMPKFGAIAAAMGTSVSDIFKGVTIAGTEMAEAAGMGEAGRKVITQDLARLRSDFKRFGDVSTTELARIAVGAKSLGISLESLNKVTDYFDDFDRAADSVAMLSQALGVNIDTMALFETEDPIQRTMMIRDAFLEAGQDITQMNRRQRRFVEAAGIDMTSMFPALAPGGAAQERGAAMRDRIAEANTAKIVRAIESLDLRDEVRTEEFMKEYVARLTTVTAETTTELKKGLAQNLVADKEIRNAIAGSMSELTKFAGEMNAAALGLTDSVTKITGETTKFTKQSLEQFSDFKTDITGKATKVASSAVEQMVKMTAAVAGTASRLTRGNAVTTTTRAPDGTVTTVASPASPQQNMTNPGDLAAQSRSQSPYNITIPANFNVDGVTFMKALAQAKLPAGQLGTQLDQLRSQAQGQSPQTLNSPE